MMQNAIVVAAFVVCGSTTCLPLALASLLLGLVAVAAPAAPSRR